MCKKEGFRSYPAVMNPSILYRLPHFVCLYFGINLNSACQLSPPNQHRITHTVSTNTPAVSVYRTMQSYAKVHHYNTSTAFFINLKIHSGKPRFFVLDLKNEQINSSALVTHGSGSSVAADSLIFSNKPGSNASSLGWYRVGASYQGRFGLAFKLHGLSASNSNAFERAVVLHAHPCVPEASVFPSTICESWGCPTVAPGFLNQLQKIIDRSKLPVLLQIVYQ